MTAFPPDPGDRPDPTPGSGPVPTGEPEIVDADDFVESMDDVADFEELVDLDAELDNELATELTELDTNELGDEISGEIIELTVERDQLRDIAQRLQADFDNYRKRIISQQAAEIDRAKGSLVESLLPVLDAAEAAYVRHPDEVGPLLNLLLGELRKQGLESIDLLGQPFDPVVAEAVAHEPGDGGEPLVAEVLRSGYTWNGRTLRAAMVRTRD